MKENEELKRRVAAQNQTDSNTKSINPQTVMNTEIIILVYISILVY